MPDTLRHKLEEFYHEIGEQSLALAGPSCNRLLLYAEVEAGVISADLFYVNEAGLLRYRTCPKPLQLLVYSLWQRWKELPENAEWRVLCYFTDGQKLNIDFAYPDQVDENEDVSDRRPRAIKKYFGDRKVDYTPQP